MLKGPRIAVEEVERVTERQVLNLEEMKGVAPGSVDGRASVWSKGMSFSSGRPRSTSRVGDPDGSARGSESSLVTGQSHTAVPKACYCPRYAYSLLSQSYSELLLPQYLQHQDPGCAHTAQDTLGGSEMKLETGPWRSMEDLEPVLPSASPPSSTAALSP